MLEEISKHHEQFKSQLIFLGCPKHLTEDFVQDMYIKCHYSSIGREIEYKKAFASFVLRNMYFDYCKKKKYEVCSDYLEKIDLFQEDCDMEKEIEKSKNIDDLFKVIPDFTEDFVPEVSKDYGVLNGYELTILLLHFKEKITMRRLSRESHISLHSIYNTIKKAKAKIKKALDEQE